MSIVLYFLIGIDTLKSYWRPHAEKKTIYGILSRKKKVSNFLFRLSILQLLVRRQNTSFMTVHMNYVAEPSLFRFFSYFPILILNCSYCVLVSDSQSVELLVFDLQRCLDSCGDMYAPPSNDKRLAAIVSFFRYLCVFLDKEVEQEKQTKSAMIVSD